MAKTVFRGGKKVKKLKINVNSVRKVKDFIDIVNKFDGDFELVTERDIVDAKSIMAIFSTDITKNIELVIHDNAPAEEAEAALAKFIV